jgi:hypothetical protein
MRSRDTCKLRIRFVLESNNTDRIERNHLETSRSESNRVRMSHTRIAECGSETNHKIPTPTKRSAKYAETNKKARNNK